MAFVRLQWISFSAMPSRTLDPLSEVTVGSMSGGFWHSVVWSVIGLSSFLLLVFGLFVTYKLHFYFLHIQIFVNCVFSHDLVLVFISNAFLFSSVILKSYSHLFNSRQNVVVGVTKRGCSTVGEAGYRACSGRSLLVA